MTSNTFFHEIETTTKPLRKELEQLPIVAASLQGDVNLVQYQAFLTQAYHHVKHTVPLLMACGSKLPDRLEWLREAVAEYIEEELGHQEWILNDIERLGGNRQDAANSKPALATELMVSYAYDTIARKNPVGFFGMVYVLEKTSATIATAAAEKIQGALKLPRKAMSYMISHGSLDVGHMQEYEVLMNKLTDAEDKQAVLHMAANMYQLYGNIFRGLPNLDESIITNNKAA